MQKTIKILGPAGVLAQNWPGFEAREGQVEMAEAVARTLEEAGRAAIEAGPGTGKTLAYLVPVLLSGLKTTISTATKNLQDQIFDKDLPFLDQQLSLKKDACLVKGRQNYLCRRRLKRSSAQGLLDPFVGQKLEIWAGVSASGDKAEVDFVPENDPLWAGLTTGSDQCLGPECPFFEDCFITRLRRRAARARVVVVNHHLFMADLALRQGGFGQVLPESEAVIFDEAHEVEAAATSHFSVSVSDLRLNDFIQDLTQNLPPQGFTGLLISLKRAVDELFRALAQPGERYPLSDALLSATNLKKGQVLIEALAQAQSAALEKALDAEEGLALAGRAEALADGLKMILGRLEGEYVYYAERLKRGLSLKAAPVEVAGVLNQTLFSRPKALIFTSATLDPPRFRARLGLPGPAEELILASPFDFAAQSLLYVPEAMPLPQAPGFAEAAADQMAALVDITQGRAFLLFTSNRNLEAVHRLLSPRLSWPCLKQGQAPKAHLIEEFMNQEGAVLMATASFWQGVDVLGPRLSLVVIDKLPFAPPEDPLVAARIQRLRSLGEEPFWSYQVPEAVLSLRQGLGRLIRSGRDKGVLAVLDVRLFKKNYGQTILKALPPSPVVRDLGAVKRWAGEKLALNSRPDKRQAP